MSESIVAQVLGATTKMPGGCWVFTGPTNSSGYGSIIVNGRKRLTHRLVCAAVNGPVPKGWHVHHTCRVKLCCRPSHLVAMTRAEHHKIHLADRSEGRKRYWASVASGAQPKPPRTPRQPKPIEHGWLGYRRGCKCEVCRVGWNEYCRGPNSRRMKHGTRYAYIGRECRCTVCVEAAIEGEYVRPSKSSAA